MALIQAGVAPHAEARAESQLIPWGTVLKSRDVLAVTISYFSFGYVAWIFFSWFYAYLAQVRGLNLKASAGYAMLPFPGHVGRMRAGRDNQRSPYTLTRSEDRAMLSGIGCYALAAVFLALGAEVESARLASIVLAGGAGALYLAQSSFWSVTADLAGPSSGSVSGFMNMGAQAGGWLTAWLTPLIATRFGWTASFLVAAALCLTGAVAWLFVDPKRTLKTAHTTADIPMTPRGLDTTVPVSKTH